IDVCFSIFMAPNKMFRNTTGENNGQISFTDVTELTGIVGPINSFPNWFFDYDNDGDLDLFIAAFDNEKLERIPKYLLGLPYTDDTNELYRNNGDGTFTSVTKAYKLDQPTVAMGCNYGDLDNDGWLDFYLGTGNPDFRSLLPNLMFRNNAGKDFQDVTYTGGFGHLQKGHGIAFGDIDMDGDQDIYHVLGGALQGDDFTNILLENPGHGNKWISINLVGTKSNRDGIGASIKVTAVYADGRKRNIYQHVNTGASFGSSPLRKEIGLGNAVAIKELEIVWPGKVTIQKFTNIQPNQFITVHEESNQVVYDRFVPVQFKPAMDHSMQHM
ncbi:MAG: CRTAC1 family protein, partial [Chitinophagales bacterium]